MAVRTDTGVPVYRLSADAYQKLVSTGALDGEHVELLDGIITEMSPQSPEHASIAAIAAKYLGQAGGNVRTHSPFEIEGADSIPEPDVLLTDEPDTRAHHPRSARVIVEVSVGSQEVDRGTKAALYARADVPVYWLVDVPASTVEVRTRPVDGQYEDIALYRFDDTLPAPMPDLPDLAVSALLGRR